MHKKTISFMVVVLAVVALSWVSFNSLAPLTKLNVVAFVVKKWARWHPSKPSSFLDESKLEAKLAQGLPHWAQAQISQDLATFKTIKIADLKKYYQQENTKNNRLVYFSVRDEWVQTTLEDPEILQFASYKAMLNVFKFLASHHYIPNTDFILSFQDVPRLKSKIPLPIFAFAKDVSIPIEKDLILMPDWMNLRHWTELRPRIQYAIKLFPWEKKINQVFWRGGNADSTGFRHQLVSLSQQYPQLIDAQITQHDVNPQGFTTPEAHLLYRYQITIDGARCAWERLLWQLHSNCLVFKHASSQEQWFYKGIAPNVHYISVRDEKALLQAIQQAEASPQKTQAIIQNAQKFAEENLEIEDMYLYLAILVQHYSERLVF